MSCKFVCLTFKNLILEIIYVFYRAIKAILLVPMSYEMTNFMGKCEVSARLVLNCRVDANCPMSGAFGSNHNPFECVKLIENHFALVPIRSGNYDIV